MKAITLLLLLVAPICLAATDCRRDAIVVDPAASALAQLAGRELRRYLWHVTARLVPIYGTVGAVPDGYRRLVVVERLEQLSGALVDATTATRVSQLQPSEHLIISQRDKPLTVIVAGGDGLGALYASYLFAHEVLGVHFSLSGDVLPKAGANTECSLSATSESDGLDLFDSPRFPLRGLQPFFNFAEGPDWWSDDHWRAVITQAAKMRMNMIAIHTYTPTRSIGTTNYSTTGVWAGQPQLWVGTPGAFSQTYGRILTVILHINGVPCCCRERHCRWKRHARWRLRRELGVHCGGRLRNPRRAWDFCLSVGRLARLR